MSKAKTDKGRPVRRMPYRVQLSGWRGMVVTLHASTGLNVGDRVDQFVMQDGTVVLRKVEDA